MDPMWLTSFFTLAMLAILWWISRAIKGAAKKYPPAAPDKSVISGVGGWLLLLILGLMFLGPLLGASRMMSQITSTESKYQYLTTLPAWGVWKSAMWGDFLFTACLSFYAGLGLMKGRNVKVVTRAKIILWVMGPVNNIVLGIFILFLMSGKGGASEIFDAPTIESIIVAVFWTAYLSSSKRVMATYGIIAPSTELNTPTPPLLKTQSLAFTSVASVSNDPPPLNSSAEHERGNPVFTHMHLVRQEQFYTNDSTYEFILYRVGETGDRSLFISKNGKGVGHSFFASSDTASNAPKDVERELLSQARDDISRNESGEY